MQFQTNHLATAGQLKTAEEFLMILLFACTEIQFLILVLRNMIKQHLKKKSFVTMSLHEYKTNLPYGVIETTKNGKVTSWNEKPEIKANINMGCYVMEPGVLKYIPKNKPYGMDECNKKSNE